MACVVLKHLNIALIQTGLPVGNPILSHIILGHFRPILGL